MDGEEEKLNSSEKEIRVPEVVDERDFFGFSYIQAPHVTDFDTQEEFEQYDLFVKEHNQTLGFDIQHFAPLRCGYVLTLESLTPLEDSNPVFVACTEAVQSVLVHLDQKDERHLEFRKITKANFRSLYMFFVTFEATDKISGETEEYKCQVHRHFLDKETILFIFMKRGDPPPKELVEALVDYRSEYEFHALGKPVLRDCKNEGAYLAYKKYVKEYNESEGFDFEPNDNPDEDHLRLRILLPETWPFQFKHCSEGVRTVVDYLNRKKEVDLEFKRVIKANYTGFCFYFVTFEAIDNKSRDKKFYQLVMDRDYFQNHEPDLYLFREKKDREKKLKLEEVVQAVMDEREHYKFREFRKRDLEKFEQLHDYCNYEKYAKEYNDSKGFDIKTVLSRDVGDRPWMLMALNISNAHDTPIFKHCKVAVETVLDLLKNLKEENLELVRVIKANYRASYMFFVTFKARNQLSRKLNTYQSVIFHVVHDDVHNVHDLTELYMFRRITRSHKAQPKSHQYSFTAFRE